MRSLPGIYGLELADMMQNHCSRQLVQDRSLKSRPITLTLFVLWRNWVKYAFEDICQPDSILSDFNYFASHLYRVTYFSLEGLVIEVFTFVPTPRR